MTPLLTIATLFWRDQRRAILRGFALSAAVALSGIMLLALSGWFILAAGMAGLAGLGTVFDVFRPSAGIRFLAIARTGSRYGERLATHDATLKVLAGLRVRLLDGLSRADFTLQSRLRGGQALNRLTADVDALDGLAIRLVFPLLALLIAALAVLTGLWLLVAPSVALWVAGATFSGAVAVLAWAGKAAFGPSSEAEARRQALRSATVDHLRGRDWLAVAGRLTAARETVLSQDRRARAAALAQAQIEHRATAALQAAGAMTLAGTLWLAGRLAMQAQITAPQAALAVFAALAMGELALALQRGIAELGRMRGAAARIAPLLEPRSAPAAPDAADAAPAGAGPSTSVHVELGELPPRGAVSSSRTPLGPGVPPPPPIPSPHHAHRPLPWHVARLPARTRRLTGADALAAWADGGTPGSGSGRTSGRSTNRSWTDQVVGRVTSLFGQQNAEPGRSADGGDYPEA